MNYEQIMYKNLRAIIAERSAPFIFWCGAGLSVPAGFPSWIELKRLILEEFEKEADEEQKEEIANIRKTTDLWVAFSRIRTLLGNASFQAYVRKYVDIKADIPEIYKELWKLNPRGMITLNLDSLVSLSYAEIYGRNKVNEFDGFSIPDHLDLLKSPTPFIVDMHGLIGNYNSWVFTKEKLNELQNTSGYREFLSIIFGSCHVVFIGISADDFAVGGILNTLVEKEKINIGIHYWITDRNDIDAKKWADKSNVGIIKYAASRHDELIDIIKSIRQYISVDKDETIVTKNEMIIQGELTKSELLQKSANDVRYYLNAKLVNMVKNEPNDHVYDAYFDFMDKNDELFHKAWYIGKTDEDKFLFDYKLLERIGGGGFGKVYKAQGKDGNVVAIKVLKEELREQKESLMCFRRGVKALSILNEHEMKNIVKYIDGSEVPLIIVMEYIDGPNLKTLIESSHCSNTFNILSVAKMITDVIMQAHSLPERVLHRDLRPTNIMFRNYYETGEYDIIILDFDFAWYKGAIEDSILRKPVGYLAPEQVFLNDKVSSRSTLIDSYSLGMLFYYMVSCSEPLFNSHLNSDWERKVYDACKSKLKSTWRSISFRFQRLILNLTKDRQNERWDVSQANSEITRLLDAEKNEKSVFAELVAEELISRMLVDQNYSCLNNEFLYNYVNGVTLRISYNEVRKAVGLTIGYQTTGVENFSNIKRYLPQRKEKTLAILKKNEWKINSDNKTSENFTINAEIDTHILLANFNNNIKDLSQIKLEYNFN